MSSRRTEFLVVGGLVLGFLLLGLREFGESGKTQAAHRTSEDAVKRGSIVDAELAARDCARLDGGIADPNTRLLCIARLVELQHVTGKVALARARMDEALAEAAALGPSVSPEARAELLIVSSKLGGPRREADARAALPLAATPLQHAAASAALGFALLPAESAGPVLRAARSEYLAIEGPGGINVATTGIELGRFLKVRDPVEAISVLQESVVAYDRLVDGGHSFGGVARGVLGAIRRRQGDFAGAESDLRAAITITRRGFGPDSVYLPDQLCDLGKALHELHRDTEALDTLLEGLALAGSHGDQYYDCRHWLALVNQRLGRDEETRTILLGLRADLERDPDSRERARNLQTVARFLARLDGDAGNNDPEHE